MPDLLRDPLAVRHALVYRVDAAIAKLGMIVADVDDDDAARHARILTGYPAGSPSYEH